MKKITTLLELSNTASSVDDYNQMKSKSKTSLLEAKRTLEALECVKANERLFNLVKKEEGTDGR